MIKNKHDVIGDIVFVYVGERVCTIDVEDTPLLSGKTISISERKGYSQLTVYHNGRNIALSRFLLGEPKGFVDHIDVNSLNNRRSNLRVLKTRSDNNQNRNGKFYTHDKERNKWSVSFAYEGVKYRLGRFDLKQDAIWWSKVLKKLKGV